MDNLVKQRRRVAISENKEEDIPYWLSELAITDIPALEWLKNQSYWYEKNDLYKEKESEFAASVAAVAYVIRSKVEDEEKIATKRSEEIEKSRVKKTIPIIPKSDDKRIKKSTIQETKNLEGLRRKRSLENHPRQEINPLFGKSGLVSAPSKTDSWEKSRLDKIRLRYEKMKGEIMAWENERKLGAKLKMEKKKSEIEKRKEMNNQHYKSKISRIQLIADGAKKQLEEKKRSEIIQVQEKAKKMKKSGKIPMKYLCFNCY